MKFKLPDFFLAKNDIKKELTYNSRLGGYLLNNALIPVDIKSVSQSNYVHLLMKNYKAVFPNYDETSQFIEVINSDLKGDIIVSLYERREIQNQIPYGAYLLKTHNCEPLLIPMNLSTNKYIDIGQKTGAKILDDFINFKNKRSFYEKENELHKRGLFLYGPPGCGKTREITRLLEHAQKEQFYAFIIKSQVPLDYLDELKETFSGEMVVIILEELTERMNQHGVESLLTFLDGESSWNNSYSIATTNYPEEIPANLIDRPGRFSNIIEVGLPNKEQKEKYLQEKNISQEDIDYIIKEFPKASLDYLRELVLLHKIEGTPLPDLIKQLLETRKKINDTFKEKITLR